MRPRPLAHGAASGLPVQLLRPVGVAVVVVVVVVRLLPVLVLASTMELLLVLLVVRIGFRMGRSVMMVLLLLLLPTWAVVLVAGMAPPCRHLGQPMTKICCWLATATWPVQVDGHP